MSGLAALGSLAGGIVRGLETGERLKSQRMANEEMKRKQDEEAKFQADLQAANEEARGWLSQQATEKNPGLAAYLNRGGSDGSMPEQPQDQTTPFKPSQSQLLKAAQVRTNALFSKGHTERAYKQWLQDEQVRGSLRGAAGEKLKASIAAGADPTAAAREFYDLVDDGMDLVSMAPRRTEDGGLVYEIVTRDPNGRETLSQATPDEIVTRIDGAMADPKAVALAAVRNKFELGQIKARGSEQRTTDAAKHEGDMKEIAARAAGNQTVAETRAGAAVDAAKARAQGSITVAQIRAGAGGSSGGGSSGNAVQSVRTNSDGTRSIIMRKPGPDGKPIVHALVGEDGKPLIGMEAEKALQGLTNQVGKSIEGSLATPEANRARAGNMLPKPPIKPANGKAGAPSLDSYFKR